MSARKRAVTGGFLALFTLVGWPIAPVSAQADSETFDFTGAPESFTVPECVSQITVDAFGAEGGGFIGTAFGGRATATIDVTPGETLEINVGGRGGDGTFAPAGTP